MTGFLRTSEELLAFSKAPNDEQRKSFTSNINLLHRLIGESELDRIRLVAKKYSKIFDTNDLGYLDSFAR